MSEHRWAVLLGVSKYEGHPKLRYSTADAVEFSNAIAENLGFDRNRMLLLVDSDEPCHSRPTRREVFHALGLLADKHSEYYEEKQVDPLGEDDLFLFYFSGHGLRTRDGKELLLPLDASRYDVLETAVPLDALIDRIAKLPCRHKVLFLDACREELYQDEGKKGVSEGAKGIGEREIVEREGLATFYSCDPGDRSYEIDDLAHGSFTFCLLEAIKHPGVNTLEELDGYLKSRVPSVNVKGGKAPQQPFSVPNPADMMKLALFQATHAVDGEDLVDQTTHLYNAGRLDFEWWDKLTGIWDAGDASNFALKRAIFMQYCRNEISFEEFEKKWRRTERLVLGTAPIRPDISTPRGGDELPVERDAVLN